MGASRVVSFLRSLCRKIPISHLRKFVRLLKNLFQSPPYLRKRNGISLAELLCDAVSGKIFQEKEGKVMAEQPNQFKCHSCGRSFSSEDQLREHEKNCSGPRPHGG